MPKVSIVLPTYNGAKYLASSICSVMEQTEPNWELIIVDDCSTDETLNIATSFAVRDGRIRVVSNNENKKLPETLNVGFRLACGEYFTWTSDDNLYKPDALKEMSRYLDNHPSTDLVSFAEDIIDENGNVQYERTSCYRNGQRDIYQFITANNIGAAFMYRKTIADKIGGYDASTFCAEDYDYWYRIAIAGRVDFVDDKNVYQYRVHNASLTATKSDQIRRKTDAVVGKYVPLLFKKLCLPERDRVIIKCRMELESLPVCFFDKAWFLIRMKFAKYASKFIFWNKKKRRRVRYFLQPHLSVEK